MPRARSCLFAGLGCLAGIVVALLLVRVVAKTTFKPYRITGGSMEPTLAKGDLVFTRSARTVRRGELVAYRSPRDNALLIHRVVALPEETVQLQNGRAIVNGLELEEPYVTLDESLKPIAIRDTQPMRVPPDSYFILGDNRDNANDSRYLGFVPRKNVTRRVVLVVSERNGVWQP